MTDRRTAVGTRDCVHRSPLLDRHAKSLRLALAITAGVMVAEVVGGWLANSLALLADAGHMLTDVAALGLALLVAWIARRPATAEKTYGYLRWEILAALVNGATLFIIAAVVVWQAVERFRVPVAVEPRILLGVALLGLVANVASLKVLHGGHNHSLNVRGAYLHVMSDLLGSIGAILAGVVIMTTGWTLADPIVSIAIAVLIVAGSWRLVRESVDVLLEAVPSHISLPAVERSLATIPGVDSVHDLHVWTLTSGVVAMSGHAVVEDPRANQQVLETAQSRLAELGIRHVTMQIERDDTCSRSGNVAS